MERRSPALQSCGVLVYRTQPQLEFLLMQHADRWDLPKGHIKQGESELQCAFRELAEETGIEPAQIQLDPRFRFETRYPVRPRRQPNQWVDKLVVIFLGRLTSHADLRVTEHLGFRWVPWQPPHRIQPQTIDPLLEYLENFWKKHQDKPPGP